MMKRYYLYIAAMLVISLASCQKEEFLTGSENQQTESMKLVLKSLLSGRDTKWTAEELAIPQTKDGWYEITSDKELAYLLEFGSTAGEKYRLAADVDLSESSIAEKISYETGVELFKNFEFDGNNKTISNLHLPLAAGVFSRVEASKIYNLSLSGCSVGSDDNVSNLLGTGALVGHATGTLEVSGVNVSECTVTSPCKVGGLVGSVTDAECSFASCSVSATTVQTTYVKGISGWCGGFVGFVGREAEKSTAVPVSVAMTECKVDGGKVRAYMESDTRYSGKFLGTLNGYDHNEVVSLNSCASTATFEGLDSEASAAVTKYHSDGFLGGHKYLNGYIYIDGLSYVTPWDGTTKTLPALVDGAYKVYTAAELAWFQGKTETANKIHICRDIDLGGHTFAPLYKASYIDGKKADGQNSEIRNLKVYRTKCGKEDGGAFIRQASDVTVHQNLIFRNASIEAFHDPESTTAGGNAYAATLCGNVTGTYSMLNVHAYNGYLYGVNKMGGLLGRLVATTSTITDCSVDGYRIVNYEVNDKPEDFAAIAEEKGLYCESCVFYPQGEIGGFIGFISSNSTISNCSVSNTTIDAVGQASQKPKIGANSWLAVSVTIAGRYVNEFIGNIRTGNAEKINMSDIQVSGNTCSRQSWTHSASCTIVGGIYYIPVLDEKGEVTLDGNSISF